MAKFLNKCSAHAANVRPTTGPATVTQLLRRNACAQLGPEWVISGKDLAEHKASVQHPWTGHALNWV